MRFLSTNQGTFAAGLLAGGAVVAAVGWYLLDQEGPARPDPPVAVQEATLSSPAPAQPLATPVAAVAPAPTGPCAFDPVLPPSGARDGKFQLDAVARASDPAQATAFVAVAREVAGEGRRRDAEVALIVACRLASRAAPAPSVPVGDVVGLLAQHYASAAADPSALEVREELLVRTRQLLEASAQSYTAVLGANASKSRTASQRLAAFERSEERGVEPLAQAALLPAPSEADLAQHEVHAGDLQQLESDLRRLRAQVEAVSPDRAGMQRREQQALARREACRDAACLRRWYTQRRSELLAEF